MEPSALPYIVDEQEIQNSRFYLLNHEKQLFHSLIFDFRSLSKFLEEKFVPLNIDYFSLAINSLACFLHTFLHKSDKVVKVSRLPSESDHHFLLVGFV
jgi:hypothetical protein